MICDDFVSKLGIRSAVISLVIGVDVVESSSADGEEQENDAVLNELEIQWVTRTKIFEVPLIAANRELVLVLYSMIIGVQMFDK
jgi:hypothetical protein